MQHLILALACVQTVRVPSVILELLQHRSLGVLGAHSLVLHVDRVDLALVDQGIVLVVSDLALLARLQLLPGLLFDHSCVGIKVLSLQSDLFQLLGKARLLFSLLLLLCLNLTVNLK